jgi:hypothetical protein
MKKGYLSWLCVPVLALGLTACEVEQNEQAQSEPPPVLGDANLPGDREAMTPTDPHAVDNQDRFEQQQAGPGTQDELPEDQNRLPQQRQPQG